MKNLGKTILILIFLTLSLNAELLTSVNTNEVVQGDSVTLSLEFIGDKPEPFNISNVCGVRVSSTSSMTNIKSINGSMNRSYVYSYEFEPTKSCTIEPIEITLDGEKVYTKKIDIKVTKVSKSTSSKYILDLNATNQSVYVGQSIPVTLTFKQRYDAAGVDSKFTPPSFKNFWKKDEIQKDRTKEGRYTVTKVTYIVTPQKEGNLSIEPAVMKIATKEFSRSDWGNFTPKLNWHSYYSNPLALEVKPLPEGVNLVGDFNISVDVDKTQIEGNEAINVTYRVVGKGNLEDIEINIPYIDGVNHFAEEPKIENNVYTKKVAFVAEKDFTIPSVELKYLSLETDQIKSIKSKSIPIDVLHEKSLNDNTLKMKKPTQEQSVVKEKVVYKNSLDELIYSFLLGAFSVLFVWFFVFLYNKSEKKTKEIKLDDKATLNLLIMNNEHPKAKEFIDILERIIYKSEKVSYDKKALKALVKELNS